MSLTKIEFKGGKIVETPAATLVPATANDFEAIVALIAAATEKDNNTFNLNPSVTDVVVSMANITTAGVVVLITDGPITVKINGSVTPIPVEQCLILFGTAVTAITASNPSATEVRSVKKYLATDAD